MKQIILKIYWATTRTYLRIRGAEVGINVKCNGFPLVKIREGGRLVIGNNVNINAARWANPHVIQGSTNFYVAAGASLILEDGVGVSGSRLIANKEIVIGSQSLIGAGCLICDSDMHEIPLGSTNEVKSVPIRIGSRCFVGASAIILKGVKLGDRAIVGAGSVVTTDVAPDTLAAGNPAKEIKKISNQ